MPLADCGQQPAVLVPLGLNHFTNSGAVLYPRMMQHDIEAHRQADVQEARQSLFESCFRHLLATGYGATEAPAIAKRVLCAPSPFRLPMIEQLDAELEAEDDEAAMEPTHCLTCNRVLDQPGDVLSANTGGWECRGCEIEMLDGKPIPDLPAPELQVWLDARRATHLEWWRESLRKAEMEPAHDEAALRERYGDMVDRMLDASCPRYVADGLTPEQARLLVLRIMPGVMETPVPRFEDL